MTLNLNNSLTFLQVNEWSFTEIVTYILLPIGGLVGFIIRYVVPKLVDANIARNRDTLDHSQEMDKLKLDYLKNQEQSSLAMMGDILIKTQEEKAEVYRFIRIEIKEAIDKVKADTSLIQGLSKRLGEIEQQQREISTYQKIIHHYLTAKNDPKDSDNG